jgi:hypothetical protein
MKMNETTDHPAERNLGGFAGWAAIQGLSQHYRVAWVITGATRTAGIGLTRVSGMTYRH